MRARVPSSAKGRKPRNWTHLGLMLGLLLGPMLGLTACVQTKERQVIQSHDPIAVGLSGQRERLLGKAERLERRGMHSAAVTIYTSLEALYPDDPEILERARLAALAAQMGATPGPLVEAISGTEESLTEDAGANTDKVNDLNP